MTLVAAHSIMIAVTKYRLKIVFGLSRSIVRSQLMTHAALSELTLGRVASVTSSVCLKADGYRFPRSRTVMAGRTSFRWPRRTFLVHSVVEFHVEPLDKFRREGLNRRILAFRVGVTDRAHYLIFVGELIKMTADARFVTAQLALDSTGFTRMAGVAGKFRMLSYTVRKGFERFVRNTLWNWVRRFRRSKRHRRFRSLLNTGRRKKDGTAKNESGFQ